MIYEVWSYELGMWQDVSKEQFDAYGDGAKRIIKLEAYFSGPEERAAAVRAREAAEAEQSQD